MKNQSKTALDSSAVYVYYTENTPDNQGKYDILFFNGSGGGYFTPTLDLRTDSIVIYLRNFKALQPDFQYSVNPDSIHFTQVFETGSSFKMIRHFSGKLHSDRIEMNLTMGDGFVFPNGSKSQIQTYKLYK